jgi:hypothetical protein
MTPEDAIDATIDYLKAMEARDLDRARGYLAETVKMVFPGGRRFSSIDEIVANSGGRYARVCKTITGRRAWREGSVTCVLITGTLYGEWKDGEGFDGIRFVDFFELEAGKIRLQEVWNDTGERVLARQAEAAV